MLISGFIDIDLEGLENRPKVVLSKKLATLNNLYEKRYVSPQIQLPAVIFNMNSILFDKKVQLIASMASNPFNVVCCIYTIKICAMIGGKFSTSMLTNSGLCPPVFQNAKMARIQLPQVLEILEEVDFIEMIDEQVDAARNSTVKYYRFTHEFMQNIVSAMVPFTAFKQQVHATLAFYHMSNAHLDVITNRK